MMDIQKLLLASKSSTSSEEGGGGVRDRGYKRRSVAMESTGKAKALRVIKVKPWPCHLALPGQFCFLFHLPYLIIPTFLGPTSL